MLASEVHRESPKAFDRVRRSRYPCHCLEHKKQGVNSSELAPFSIAVPLKPLKYPLISADRKGSVLSPLISAFPPRVRLDMLDPRFQ